MNPAPCVPITGRTETERDTSAVTIRTGWGGGVLARRRFRNGHEAWWVFVEGPRSVWRLCELAMLQTHPGDRP